MSSVAIVRSEEGWSAMYVNCKLAYQGDSWDAAEVLEVLAARRRRIDSVYTFNVTEETLESWGYEYPPTLDELDLVGYECAACSSKPGSPTLCAVCVEQREVTLERLWQGPRPMTCVL
jgi:hypothetical protein